MQGRIRVLVYYRQPAGATADVTRAYQTACQALAGTPGLLGHELLGQVDTDDRYVLLMLWRDLDDFLAWERDLRAGGHPSPLRRLQDRSRPGGHYELYQVRGREAGGTSFGA